MMAVWYESPAVVGLVVGAPMAIVAALGWWRTRGMDAATKQAASESGHTAHVAQIQAGLEAVIKALQEDNRVLRGDRELEREINRLRDVKDVVAGAKDRIAVIENNGDTLP